MHAVRRFHTGTEKHSACSREAVCLNLHGNQVQIYMHFREIHKKVHTWLLHNAQLLNFSSPSINLRLFFPQNSEVHTPNLTSATIEQSLPFRYIFTSEHFLLLPGMLGHL